MDEITSVFVTESREQLATLESALLQLEGAWPMGPRHTTPQRMPG